jgi:hypothetical protein
MQTRPLPETADARSPAGAEIRYLIGGTTGDMIQFHRPARAGEPGDRPCHSERVLARPVRPGGNLAPGRERGRSDRSDSGRLHRNPGRCWLPVPVHGRGSAAVSVHHDAALAGRRGGNPDRGAVDADSASRPGVFRDRTLRAQTVHPSSARAPRGAPWPAEAERAAARLLRKSSIFAT